MTPDELKRMDESIKNMYATFDWHGELNDRAKVLEAARTLSQLMHGTHPDLVVVQREPTVNMWEAGVCARRKAHNYALADQVDDIYKAMISAARKDEK